MDTARKVLPAQGRAWESIRTEMLDMGREDADWRSGRTAVAVASLFTSRYPSGHGVTPLSALPSRAVTLAEVLRSGGYRCGAFVGNPSLNRSSNLQQGFDVYQDRSVRSASQPASAGPAATRRPAALLTADALAFAQEAEPPWFGLLAGEESLCIGVRTRTPSGVTLLRV